jgi:hypothetical protein
VQRATILGHAVAANAGTLVDVEYGVLVAVERHRLAVSLDVALGGLHVVEKSGLPLDEPQQLQPAGRIIDVREHGTVRASILKPAMF